MEFKDLVEIFRRPVQLLTSNNWVGVGGSEIMSPNKSVLNWTQVCQLLRYPS